MSVLRGAKGQPADKIYERLKKFSSKGKKYDIILLPDGSRVTRDRRRYRIRIFYDEDGLVTSAINA